MSRFLIIFTALVFIISCSGNTDSVSSTEETLDQNVNSREKTIGTVKGTETTGTNQLDSRLFISKGGTEMHIPNEKRGGKPMHVPENMRGGKRMEIPEEKRGGKPIEVPEDQKGGKPMELSKP